MTLAELGREPAHGSVADGRRRGTPGTSSDAVKAAAREGCGSRRSAAGHSFTGDRGAPTVSPCGRRRTRRRVRVDGTPRDRPRRASRCARSTRCSGSAGSALPNLGDIDAQTVAGAISTGTHGTGAGYRSIAAQVRALRDRAGRRLGPRLLADRERRDLRRGPGRAGRARRADDGDAGVRARRSGCTPSETALPLAARARRARRAGVGERALRVLLVPAHRRSPRPSATTAPTPTGPVRGRVAEWVGDELLGNGAFELALPAGRARRRGWCRGSTG